MKTDIDNGQFLYNLFYQVPFLLMLIIYLIEGYKRRFSWSTWLLVIIMAFIFFIIGSKFGAITHDGFSYFIHYFQFPAQHSTNVMGVIVFVLGGIGFAKWPLCINYPVTDALINAAPVGMAVQGSYLLSLKAVQWINLLAVFMLAAIIIIREKRSIKKDYTVQPNHPLLSSSYLLLLSVLLYVTRNWFTDIEFYVLLIALIPATLFVARDIITNYFTSRIRISTLSLLAFSLLIMSQANPQNKAYSYQSFSIGHSGGVYTNTHNTGMGTGCDRQSMSQDFAQKYQLGGIGYSVIKKDSFNMFEYGLNGYYGSQSETGLTSGITQTNPIWGINPFVSIGNKWFGGRVGLHIGDLRMTPALWSEEKTPVLPKTGTQSTFLSPQLFARIGIERILFVSYHYRDQFPSPFPIMYSYLELGSGLGARNGFKLSVGINTESAMLFKTEIPIMNRFLLIPMYQKGIGDYRVNDQCSVGLHYMFGFR